MPPISPLAAPLLEPPDEAGADDWAGAADEGAADHAADDCHQQVLKLLGTFTTYAGGGPVLAAGRRRGRGRRGRSSRRRDHDGRAGRGSSSGRSGRSRVGGKRRASDSASVGSSLDLSRTRLLSGEDVSTLHVARSLVDGADMLVVSREVSSGVDGLSSGDRAGEQREDREERDELHCCGVCVGWVVSK